MTERGGFTLIEVIVWIAVLTILAAAITPSLATVDNLERRQRAETLLQGFEDGVLAFGNDIGMYPASLAQLLEGPANGDDDLCAAKFKNSDVNKWAGPYIYVVPGPSGYRVAVGYAASAFTYQVMSTIPYLRITVDQVLENDAVWLDAAMDSADSSTAGTIRWGTPDADGFVTMTYNVVVPAC